MNIEPLVSDTIFALRDGYYCIVDGRIYGPWPHMGYAIAGLATEQRRAAKRKEKSNE